MRPPSMADTPEICSPEPPNPKPSGAPPGPATMTASALTPKDWPADGASKSAVPGAARLDGCVPDRTGHRPTRSSGTSTYPRTGILSEERPASVTLNVQLPAVL